MLLHRRYSVLKQRFKEVLRGIVVSEPVEAFEKLRSKGVVTVGKYTYYGVINIVYYGEINTKVDIGRFCSIATNLKIFLGGNHNYKCVSCYPLTVKLLDETIPVAPLTKGDITIGNDVWIGRDATIMSGVNVGDGAVIGAASVVTKDVPPYGIAVGNPARLVRYRFSEELIEGLLRIRWWDWPLEKIVTNIDIISSENVDEFVAVFSEQS